MCEDTMEYQKKIANLEQELMVAKAYQIHNLHFASQNLKSMAKKDFTGSGVIITVMSLSGLKLIDPTVVSGGLSKETIDCLIADLKRSFEEHMVLKP